MPVCFYRGIWWRVHAVVTQRHHAPVHEVALRLCSVQATTSRPQLQQRNGSHHFVPLLSCSAFFSNPAWDTAQSASGAQPGRVARERGAPGCRLFWGLFFLRFCACGPPPSLFFWQFANKPRTHQLCCFSSKWILADTKVNAMAKGAAHHVGSSIVVISHKRLLLFRGFLAGPWVISSLACVFVCAHNYIHYRSTFRSCQLLLCMVQQQPAAPGSYFSSLYS